MPQSRGKAEVETLAGHMLHNLNLGRNRAKGHWRNMTWWQLWRQAGSEFCELCGALRDLRRWREDACVAPYVRERVRSELADLCITLMMIADKAGAFWGGE